MDKVIALVVAALALTVIGAGKALAWLLARIWRAAAAVAARRRERRKRQPAQEAVSAQPEPACATPWSPPAVAQAADAIYTERWGRWWGGLPVAARRSLHPPLTPCSHTTE